MRPNKQNADYFSHDSWMRDGRRIKALRRQFWLEGYAIWVMLLEVLANSDNFQTQNNDVNFDLLSGDFGADPDKIKGIISFCVRLWLLIEENGYIYSQELIERMRPLLEKRERERQRRIEKQKEKQKPKKPKSRKQADEKMTVAQFEQFWAVYPKKRAKAKAQEKFLELPRNKFDTIMDALHKQKKSDEWTKENGQYIPMPTTYINQGRWEDQLTYNNNKTHDASKTPKTSSTGKVSQSGSADIIL